MNKEYLSLEKARKDKKIFIPQNNVDRFTSSAFVIKFTARLSDSGMKELDTINRFQHTERIIPRYKPLNFWGRITSHYNVPLFASLFTLISFFITGMIAGFNDDWLGNSVFVAFLTGFVSLVVLGVVFVENNLEGFSHPLVKKHWALVSVLWEDEKIIKKHENRTYHYYQDGEKAKHNLILADNEIFHLLSKYNNKYSQFIKKNEKVYIEDSHRTDAIYDNVLELARISTIRKKLSNHHNSQVKEELEEFVKEKINSYDFIRDELISKIQSEIKYMDDYHLDLEKEEILDILG